MKQIIMDIWTKALEMGFQFNETDAHSMLTTMRDHKDYMKLEVCTMCLSPEITDPNCNCVVSSNHPTIELEFEVCPCCDNLVDAHHPPDTHFNRKQLEKL